MGSTFTPAGSVRRGSLANPESLLKKEMNRKRSVMGLQEGSCKLHNRYLPCYRHYLDQDGIYSSEKR